MKTRKAEVLVHGKRAGVLEEIEPGREYRFAYRADYTGPPVSLTLPITQAEFSFDRFPAFFDGLLPEGVQLTALLRRGKIDEHDLFSQLIAVGADLVGAVTVEVLAAESSEADR
ncbi:MAG: HipA N-terminal domain-containing protein [Planctomycetota bacterium]|jgi:serine/threonine-protein kinase HipA